MPIRLIALDLDGTTLDRTSRIRPRTRDAVAAATAAGVEVLLVTGRHHGVARLFHEELALTTPVICCNGTYLYDFAAERALDGRPIPPEGAAKAIATIRRHGVHAAFYADNDIYFERMAPHLESLATRLAVLPEDKRPAMIEAPFEAMLAGTAPIWKAVVHHPDRAVLAAWYADISTEADFNVEYSWRDRVDVMTAGNSKGARLLDYAIRHGIDPAEIAAFGDNHNDITMLTSVGRGFAMGNADDKVKAVVPVVIGDNDSDALAETILTLL